MKPALLLAIACLALCLGCAAPADRYTMVQGGEWAHYSTGELQNRRQQLYQSIRDLPSVSGLPPMERFRYNSEKRDDLNHIEYELLRRWNNGDVEARPRLLNGNTNRLSGTIVSTNRPASPR